MRNGEEGNERSAESGTGRKTPCETRRKESSEEGKDVYCSQLTDEGFAALMGEPFKRLGDDMPQHATRTSFKPGHPGGPGRPKRSTERSYLRATVRCCKLSDWEEIVRKAVADAKEGDDKARTWLSNLLVGREPLAVLDLVEDLRAQLEELQYGAVLQNGQTPVR